MNIVEAFQALQQGKRVEDFEGDEVILTCMDRLRYKEGDITEDNKVPLNEYFLNDTSFRLIEEPSKVKKYYRLQEGEFKECSRDLFEFHSEHSELLDQPFEYRPNDDILSLYKTKNGHFDILKIVEVEE